MNVKAVIAAAILALACAPALRAQEQADSLRVAPADTTVIVRDTIAIVQDSVSIVRDTIAIVQDSVAIVQDTVAIAQDTVARRSYKEIADSIRTFRPSVRTNLVWAASSTPNIGLDIPVGKHFSVGGNFGLKPWQRWLPWDTDNTNPQHWRTLTVAPELRWWPKRNYHGFFAGADLVYIHYNVAGINTLGLYPEALEYRLQGDWYGIGLFLGWSWKLSTHLRLEAEAGVAAGYRNATKYQCEHCGSELSPSQGTDIVPKLGLNLAYDLFSNKRVKELAD
ncbi:MAG: DUF3575 domain-containing protein [Bacteroidales bacterium]|nr:DUF3575 domain-containing protein [Bacteroidales bacterium]